ncbi:uncharacterized protein LOC116426721 [Nomia melanderi]|uniref:uncharacterized protein LOC116426721 n=1 Tax=Nomia melanderi TaxID=2448451 RepID=UPI003FCE6FE8
MNFIEGKIRKWIILIQAEKLNEVIEDIQANTYSDSTDNINKYIFKVLLYLSHTADKCNKQNCVIGVDIYKLTCLLCSILTEIPDTNKFASSLFHIVRCLLTINMYKEAFEVCCFLDTNIICSSHMDMSNILVKVAYLWNNSVNNAFSILQSDSKNARYYHQLKEIIKHELEIIQIVHKSYTKHLFMKISSYLDKLASIKESATHFNDFSVFIIEYLKETEIFLKEEENHVISRQLLHIVSRIICENINEKGMKFGLQILDDLINHFKIIIRENEECYECYEQFKSFCLTVMKPADILVENNGNRIRDVCDNYKKIAKKYGYSGFIKWITFSIGQILEPLFMYWETCIKVGNTAFLKNGILLETMNLVAATSKCFVHHTSDKCKSCQNIECMVRKDMYNEVVIKTRCVNLISKLSANDLSRDIYRIAQRFLEQNIAYIYEMKMSKCKCWPQLWSSSGALLYNIGIMTERFYEESVSLLSLLCSSIIQFEGIQQKSCYINLHNPICFTLHRISSLHYNHGMYREAMTASALNALLSYNDSDSKAFRMWANIKHKSVTSKEIMDITILSCLKSDKIIIEKLGLTIELSKYDLVEICLKEAKGLQAAKVNLSDAIHKVLDEMIALKASPVQYARGVQLLLYHLLNFDYNENVLDRLKQAVFNLKQTNISNFVLCLQANLEFYIFVAHLNIASKKTQIEMENMKYALYAPKISEIGESESSDVVPAYTMINIKEDSRLRMYLEAALKKWNKCFKQNIEEIVKSYEGSVTLHTLIIAGEYARLYRYQKCEIDIWKLAYKLACQLQDNRAIIYVTSRSISLRFIDPKWITTTKELVNKFENTKDVNMTYVIGIFWISLSDFYFECNMYEKARKLLDESRKLPGISFVSNIAVYLYSLDRILYNCSFYKEDMRHEEYTRYIVETLYTLVNLSEELSTRKWKPQDKHLFGFDILLSATINLSLRMNSLLSFREIGAHLVRRLRTAQALGATIRVAEVLKSLCYIDLSRSQLNDCEVKLQGLEHILNIETFKTSVNPNSVKMIAQSVSTPVRIIEPVRDVPQNDTSPILRNKCFDFPEFMDHINCNCYACENLSYKYLVFVSTHIRAQLYALQKNYSASLQHFNGAFKIKEKLMKIEKSTSKDKNDYFSWQERFYSTDYILLLNNFSYFLRSYPKMRQDPMNILFLASQLCDLYKLKGHPVYMSTKELMFDCDFQKIIDRLDYSSFTVPDISDIDIRNYETKSKAENIVCVTPIVNNIRTKKPATLKRNRDPPLLKLNKISMNFSDDEDNTFSPQPEFRRTRSRSKLRRRKIFSDEGLDNSTKTKEETNESHKLSFREFADGQEQNVDNIFMKDIVNKITSLAPDVSEHLHNVADNLEEPATSSNIQKLLKRIEDLKVNAVSHTGTRRTRHSKQLTSSDCSKIDKIIALFNELEIDQQKNNYGSTKHDVIPDPNGRINEENSVERLEQNKLTVKQYNKIDNLKKIQVSENTTSRISRKSVKQNTTTKETYNTKPSKSK